MKDGDEDDFPRGGKGTLTPLEFRDLKAKAERDALFEVKFAVKLS